MGHDTAATRLRATDDATRQGERPRTPERWRFTRPTTPANLASRPLLGWFWQNDPLFRVRYRY